MSLICPVAVLLVFCLAAPGAGRSLAPEQLSPRDQEARERYLAARSDFLELLRDAEQRVEASQLSLAVTYYRSAELRAERGYYSAALLDIQRAINELQRALGDALDEGLARSAERQLTRLNEMLAEAERLARNVDTDAVRRDLAQAYRELEEARRAFNEQRYRDVLNLTRRGIQMAQEALRLARRGGIEAEERIRERVAAMLRTMDELAAKAQNAPVPAGNVDIPQILAELAELASRAHAAADRGHIEAAIRLADRTTRLARLVLRQAGLHDEMPPDRLLQELEGLTNLLQRGRILVAEQPEPTALRFLDDAEADLAAAQEAIHQSEFTEAERSIREGTEKVIRALGLLGPGSSTLERHAREALQQLRGRFIPAAEDILEAQPVNDDARSYLDRARALGDQAERQIAGQQPLAALGSIRIAVELTIQAVRRAAASQLPPITEHD